jgi:hypothetical protein
MTTFIAKPFTANLQDSMLFESMFKACEYLNEVTGVEPKMKVDEWIVLGKLLEVDTRGETSMPKYFPKLVKGEIKMQKLDMDSFL